MNNQPDNKERPQGSPRSTGNFRVNIDESRLPGNAPQASNYPRNTAPIYGGPGSNKKVNYTEAELKAERKAHKKRDKLKARKNRRVFSVVWLAMVLLVSFTLASYLITGSNDFLAAGRPDSTAKVTIPDTPLTEKGLSELLYQKGIIGKPEFFEIYCSIRTDMKFFQPGVYELPSNLDYEDIINRLQGGNESKVEVTVTFPEGLTALEIGALLETNEVCTQEEFLTALNEEDFTNYDMIANITNGSDKYYLPEGYLFPDTYNFYQGENLDSVIGKMLNNFQNKITSNIVSGIEASGMSMDQIITLASIIQAEAANQQDMYSVSAVLHNRLSFGMDYGIYGLACDSTIYYPYKTADAVPKTGSLPHGNYNTYDSEKVSGLPAGAICNPSLDAIKAAISPSTDGDAPYYLYFCHGADGTAYYATTQEGHEENLVLAGLA